MTIKQLFSVFIVSACALSAVAQVSNDVVLQPCRRGTFRYDRLHRRAIQEQDRGPGGNYFTGEKHQLVVLASFVDNPFMGNEAATFAQWNMILNTVQLNQPPFVGSVHDYFYDQSYGQFDLVFDMQFVQVDSCRRYRSTITDDENSQYLVQDIMDVLRERNIEWDRYDWNGDGYVNQLLIIFAGQGSAYGHFGPSYDAIWPHQWWLSMHYKDRKQGIFCSPDTIHYQSQDYIVDSYCAVSELSSDSTYGTFGTICHEYTHCLGFPDFYNNSTVIGSWDLMDSGNYGENGFRPTGFSAHERWLMGWLTPVELTQSTTVTSMPALTDQPVAYLIRNDAYPNEFYMLENRQQKGWDAAIPGSGLTVFHIDYDPYIWITGNANTPNQKHYVIIPANNFDATYFSSQWAYPYVSGGSIINDALTNTSEPAAALWHANTDGTKLMSKPLTNISVTDSLVSFSFMPAPEPITNIIFPSADELSSPANSQARKIFRNGNLYILLGGKTYTFQGQLVR